MHLFAEFDGIIRVFDGFKAHQFTAFSGLVYMPPVHATFDDFVVSLEEDAAVAKVVEEGIHGWLDIEGIKPKGENACFPLAFCIEVFDDKFLFFGDRV